MKADTVWSDRDVSFARIVRHVSYAVLLMKFTRSRTGESLSNLSRVRLCHAQQLKSVEMVIENRIIRNAKPRH